MKQGLFTIELTPEEISLVEAIKFDPHATLGDTQAFHANGDLVVQLTTSLLDRDAIPVQRLRYFTDPDYYVGGRGSSRQSSFMGKGHDSESMMRHGHFLKYLRYFIYGADLPGPALQCFTQAVEGCGPITSGDIVPLRATARELARTYHLEPKAAADEFYKLCLDLNLGPSDAASIRSSVQQSKPKR